MIRLRDAALKGEFPEVFARTVLSWFHQDPGTARRLLGASIDSLGIDTRPKILHCSIGSRVVVFRRGVPPPDKTPPVLLTSQPPHLTSDLPVRLDTLRNLRRHQKAASRSRERGANVAPSRPPPRTTASGPPVGLCMYQEVRQILLCPVCEAEITLAKRNLAMQEVVLFGAANFALCCCCFQTVAEDMAISEAYQRRWIDYRRTRRIEESKRR
jgi:hypothetical protein